jgi:hypothetical protein
MLRFLTDWDEASRHPVKTTIACASFVWIGLAIVSYLTVASRSIAPSLILSGLTTVAFVVILVSRLRENVPKGERSRILNPRRAIFDIVDVLLVTTGIAVIVGGVVYGNWTPALGGLILAALGAGMFAIRRLV